MKEFRGTKKIYAVEYAGFIRMNDEPYYEGNDVLDQETVGKEVAIANSKIFEAAPDLLEALQDALLSLKMMDKIYTLDKRRIERAELAINKALE